jgi:tetratricopeptide (TPR) repeat protein
MARHHTVWFGFGITTALLMSCSSRETPARAPAPSLAQPVQTAVTPAVTPPVDAARVASLISAGDGVLKVNVEAAIEKYDEALKLSPSDKTALLRLGTAYDKQEDWERAASAYERLARVAPNAADNHYRHGRALIELARVQQQPAPDLAHQAREAAKLSLERCLQLEPKHADCASLAGEAQQWADHPQAAAELYTRAISADPTQARNYLALAGLYRAFKRPLDAETVLSQAMQRVPPTPKTQKELAGIAVSLAEWARERGDASLEHARVESAEALIPEDAPELMFELGQLYATAPDGSYESAKSRARRLLYTFSKRVCRGSRAQQYASQCEISAMLLMRLGDLDGATPVVSAPDSQPVISLATPVTLPSPELALGPIRDGDAYTVWGASYYLRSANHRSEIYGKPVAIVGYIGKTNLPDAPRCAVHRSGLADPEDCRAPIPAFWLCDQPNAAQSDCIKVLGFASNYVQILEAIRAADSKPEPESYSDEYWGQLIPDPLPVAGAKWIVRGIYKDSFSKASSGALFDPIMGILDYADREVLDPGPTLATLPGVKRRPR